MEEVKKELVEKMAKLKPIDFILAQNTIDVLLARDKIETSKKQLVQQQKGGEKLKAETERLIEESKNKEKLVEDVMEEMVKRNFTVGDAEEFPEKLARALKRNSERFEKNKTFAIFRHQAFLFTSGSKTA